ncbi:hypothetical protein GG344DRAFT_80675 [Lentinula edodes]|nr:hypothetical protein GG344DRAFT_80675 [Lentinula edodes]
MTDVLAGANGFSLQESSINVVSGHQMIFNLPPSNTKATNIQTHRRLFEKTLKSSRLHPRRYKRPVEGRNQVSYQRCVRVDPPLVLQHPTRRHSRKPIKRERKGRKMSLSANFRFVDLEELYLLGSPFPPCPTTAIEDYDREGNCSYAVDLRATRSMYSAHINGTIFTTILYEGSAAYEVKHGGKTSIFTPTLGGAYYRSLASENLTYLLQSVTRHPNLLQLYGINDQEPIPALVFYSGEVNLGFGLSSTLTIHIADVIPLSFFIRQCSPIALCCLQLRWANRGQAMVYLNRPVSNEELFMQTLSGLLCVGPMGPCVEHEDVMDVIERSEHHTTPTWSPQLPSKEYTNESEVIRYIEKYLKDFHKFVGKYHTPPMKLAWLSMPSCEIYKLGSVLEASTGDQVAFLESSPDWTYNVFSWDAFITIGRGNRCNCSGSEDGWMRYRFSSDIPSISFQISCSVVLVEPCSEILRAAWLAQARYISESSKRQIELPDCILLDHVSFSLTFSFEEDVFIERPLYLFVAPLVLGSNEESSSCSISLMPLLSYWSFDPKGNMADLEDAPILAQLPSPALATSGGSQWKHYQYKAIEQYQRFIGHDHKSRSYAEIHGLPRAHALWSRGRSEELAENSPQTLYDHGLENLISLKEEIDNIQGMYNFLRLKDIHELYEQVSNNTHAQESSYYSSPSPAREELTIQVTGHDSSLQEVESDFLSSFEGLLEEPSEIQDTNYDSSFPEVEFLSSFEGLGPSREIPIIQITDYDLLLLEKEFVPSIEGIFDSEGLSKEISINQVTDQDPSLSEVDFLSSFEGLFDEPEDIISISI